MAAGERTGGVFPSLRMSTDSGVGAGEGRGEPWGIFDELVW